MVMGIDTTPFGSLRLKSSTGLSDVSSRWGYDVSHALGVLAP